MLASGVAEQEDDTTEEMATARTNPYENPSKPIQSVSSGAALDQPVSESESEYMSTLRLLAKHWQSVAKLGPSYACSLRPARSTPGSRVGRPRRSAGQKKKKKQPSIDLYPADSTAPPPAPACNAPVPAPRPVQTEVCLSYGERSAEELLNTYGFVPLKTRGWLASVTATNHGEAGYLEPEVAAAIASPAAAISTRTTKVAAGGEEGGGGGDGGGLHAHAIHLPWETLAVDVACPMPTGSTPDDARRVLQRLGAVGVLATWRRCLDDAGTPCSGDSPQEGGCVTDPVSTTAPIELISTIELPCVARAADQRLVSTALRIIGQQSATTGLFPVTPAGARSCVDASEAESYGDGDACISQSLDLSSILAPMRVLSRLTTGSEARCGAIAGAAVGALDPDSETDPDPYVQSSKGSEMRAWELLLGISGAVLQWYN